MLDVTLLLSIVLLAISLDSLTSPLIEQSDQTMIFHNRQSNTAGNTAWNHRKWIDLGETFRLC